MLSNDSPSHAPSGANPIGVFDSGLGGLTVVAALRALLAHESIVYLGDTARVPYGTRSGAVVRRYAQNAARFLLEQGAKTLVIACNTASAHALQDLQSSIGVPVIGVIEAGASAAAQVAVDGPIGVVATESTVQSNAYQKALARLAPRAAVHTQACPLLVPLAEEGLVDHAATRLMMDEYIKPLLIKDIRALILGCTHYPVFMSLWKEHCAERVALIDSATAVAGVVKRSLTQARLLAEDKAGAAPASLKLYATDVTSRVKRSANLFLGETAPDVSLVDL